jgi:hypothetical protein
VSVQRAHASLAMVLAAIPDRYCVDDAVYVEHSGWRRMAGARVDVGGSVRRLCAASVGVGGSVGGRGVSDTVDPSSPDLVVRVGDCAGSYLGWLVDYGGDVVGGPATRNRETMTGVDVAVFLGVGAGGIGTVVASAAGADPGGQLSIGLASAAAAMLAFVVWLLRRLDERAASARLETTAILTKLVADKEDQIVGLKAEIRDLRRELGKDDT